jgi:hypothetical protein
MLKENEEAVGSAAHRDLILLIKEYARQGYEQTEGSESYGFEKLWRAAFHLTESESVIQAAKKHP